MSKKETPMPDDLKLKIAEQTDDPYDLAKLRVSQDFLETAPVKKLLTTVPMRKPGPQDLCCEPGRRS